MVAMAVTVAVTVVTVAVMTPMTVTATATSSVVAVAGTTLVAAMDRTGASAPAGAPGVCVWARALVCRSGRGRGDRGLPGCTIPGGELGEHLTLQRHRDSRQDDAVGVLELGDQAPTEHAQLAAQEGR